MPHFLVKKEEILNGFIELTDNENLFHITRVLRVKEGEEIKFIDSDGFVYFSKITEIKKNYLKAEILSKIESQRYLKTDICLVQSILMNDAQNLAIANATQTGIRELYPVMSDNVSVSKNSVKGKVEKWQKISLENFKQCERRDLMRVYEIDELFNVLNKFKKENILIFAEKDANLTLNDCLKNVDKSDKIVLVTGPEGGFSDREFDYFKKNNYKLVTLGKMIYKAPCAVIAGVSNIVSRIDDV